jgi:hypothetical protein
LSAIAIILLAALVSVPAWGSSTALPGTINYVEGQVSIGNQALKADSVGSAELQAGQTLTTANGRAEILLTPGIFLRLDNNSSVTMITPSLTDTRVELLKGRANVEVTEIHKENSIRIASAGASTELLKKGLYEFDADRNLVRVFDGKATVEDQGRSVDVKGGREVSLNAGDELKARKFDKDANEEDELYRWSKLRSSYLAEANNDAARMYVGNAWYGGGWYWDPWFGAYTFIPANGVFYSPFGWGFYSPSFVFGDPFFGPRFHRFVSFAPRFDPRVPRVVNGFRPAPARPVPGAGAHPAPRPGGARVPGGGFHGARGFHGGTGSHGSPGSHGAGPRH